MAISLRPMSFHCSRTASEGLGAGFGGAFFASCVRAGIAAKHAANNNATKRGNRFSGSLLGLTSREEDTLGKVQTQRIPGCYEPKAGRRFARRTFWRAIIRQIYEKVDGNFKKKRALWPS